MDVQAHIKMPTVGYMKNQKTLRGQSNTNYSYHAKDVAALFATLGISDIKSTQATAAVLSHLFPNTYPPSIHPGDFFNQEKVELSSWTREVKDSSREGIVVEYKNSFGWGSEGKFDHSLYGSPFFSALSLSVRLKAQDKIYLPRTEDFTEQRLVEVIFGPRIADIEVAHPELQLFAFYHPFSKRKLDEYIYDEYAFIQMAPRDHTFAKVLAGEDLFRKVLATFKESQPEFEQYVKSVENESKAAQAQQKIAGIHNTYTQAFEGTGSNVNPIAEYSLGCSESAAIQSLEQLKLELWAQKANALHVVSQRFIERGLRDRLVDYFTQSGLKMEPITRRYFDDEP